LLLYGGSVRIVRAITGDAARAEAAREVLVGKEGHLPFLSMNIVLTKG